MESCVLAPAKVAVSVFVKPDVAPGKVFTPVLQLVWPAAVTQLPFVGVALQLALVKISSGARVLYSSG